ncbi:hypothetical protein Tco_1350520 [Tanacetum coccineum]
MRTGIMPTKIELEQSQQGVNNDVLVSIEGDEELKRNVWIKGEKKEALHTYLDVLVMITCKHGESSTSVLEDLMLLAGNPVKEILSCWDLRFDDYKTKYAKLKKVETTRT